MISHELNTPLNGILGFSEILKSELNNPEHRELAEMLFISANRLRKFSDTAIFITELQLKKPDYAPKKEYNLQVLLDEIIEDLNEQLQKKEITISKKIIIENKNVIIDWKLVKLAITSILENAIRYSPKGAKITIKQKIEKNHLSITISDHGPGFSKEVLPQIFELFTTSDIMYHSEGLGLSLSTVKLIMDIHKGKVKAKNNKNGAEVTMSLPLTDDFGEDN